MKTKHTPGPLTVKQNHKKSIMRKIIQNIPEEVITFLIVCIVIALIIISWNFAAYRDVEQLKREAPAFIEERGYTITSFDGYEGDVIHGGSLGTKQETNRDYFT